MNMESIILRTSKRMQLIDITAEINNRLHGEGICLLFVPHTTAAITVNENTDINVQEDIIRTLENIVPKENNYKHLEGNSQAHILSSIIGHSLALPFRNGQLLLGQWQGVFFVELDGPRTRKVHINLNR